MQRPRRSTHLLSFFLYKDFICLLIVYEMFPWIAWAVMTVGIMGTLFLWSVTPGGLWKRFPIEQKPEQDRKFIQKNTSRPGESERLRAFLYGGQFIPGFSRPNK
jgi:hypothetical protein